MKLVLYSGGASKKNEALTQEFLRLLGPGQEEPRLTFIPADPEDGPEEFAYFRKSYKKYGLEKIEYCALNDGKAKQQRALSGEAIFLGGGNTYHFLKQMRDTGFLSKLKNFVKKGGVLLGESAGAILMTPTIHTAAVPSAEADDNEVALKKLGAIGLVPFEFSPHYQISKRSDQELCDYSKNLPHPVYACGDGSGIVVEGKKISFIGIAHVFFQGKKYTLH